MAYGTELFFAFDEPYKALETIAARLAQGWDPRLTCDDGDWYDLFSDFANNPGLTEPLREAQISLLTEHFGKPVPHGHDGRYLLVTTPAGPREFAPFVFEYAYDPDEVGDRPEDLTVGVALTGRYFPVFVDWQYSHGGSGSPIRLDRATHKFIDAATRAISDAIPEFSDLPTHLAVVFRHY